MDKTYINLTDFELEVIVPALAEWRRGTNRQFGVHDKKISTEPGMKIDMDGAKGELVWAKYLNIYPDFSTEIRSGGAELTYRGWSIDAKFKNGGWKDILTPIDTPLDKSEIYAACGGHNPYELYGWCFNFELIDEKNITMAAIKSYKRAGELLYNPRRLLDIPYKV